MKRYGHVAVVGIDGMGGFNALTDTPCMDAIFTGGAATHHAYSMDPTISAENWGGMLLGTEPAVHGLTNGYISSHPYTNDALPSLFRRIRDAFPDAYLASVVNWNPINIGIVEDGLGVEKRTARGDEAVTDEVVACVAKKPVFLFVQLDNVDGAGHHYGYGEPGHLKRITEIDALVGRIYRAYVDAGIADDTLFICIADHGGNEHGHGGWTDGEKYVFFAAAGRDVPGGQIPFAVTKDISATVLYALGLDVPAYTPGGYTSQVPACIFPGVGDDYIRPAAVSHAVIKPTADFASGLGSLFAGRVRGCWPFDSSLADVSGQCETTERGAVKFYSNGVRSQTAEFGATGAAVVEGLDLGGSFTICCWLLADADIDGDVCVLGDKSPQRGSHQERGFNLLLRRHSVMAQFGSGDDDADTVTAFPADGFRGWLHVAVSVDREKGLVDTWLDFERLHRDRLDPAFTRGGDAVCPFTIGDDGYLRFNRERGLIFRMDELLVLDGMLTEADAQALRKHYE